MVALTVDGWDDKRMRAYLGVTAHFLRRMKDGKPVLQSALIAFLPTPGRHTGQILAKALLKVTDRAGITEKVGLFNIYLFSCSQYCRFEVSLLMEQPIW